ncbi:hypothetical protein ABVF33_00740 [Candidatus Rickettsia barbariae]|uniref:hypothetical protein n=1 Tax=Rickettsia africae TaxID=35788 RepID=UPI000169CB02|nr:hypothetical protein [Rickettsia africae]
MQNNKEIIKYIVSSIWSYWNPINWSPSIQLATLSYILSCLIDGNDALLGCRDIRSDIYYNEL